jgi:hypothetical protein
LRRLDSVDDNEHHRPSARKRGPRAEGHENKQRQEKKHRQDMVDSSPVNYSHSAPSFEGSQGIGRDAQQAE